MRSVLPSAFAAVSLLLPSFSFAQIELQVERFEAGELKQGAIIVKGKKGDVLPPLIQAIQIDANLVGPKKAFSWSSNGIGTSSGVFGSTTAGGDMMKLLQNKSIRDEIELVDGQYEKMQNVNKTVQEEMMKQIKGLMEPAGGGKDRTESTRLRAQNLADLMKKLKKQKEAAESQLKELLLPHQIKRLQELAYQVSLKNGGGTVDALTRGKLKEELELNDKDVEKLKMKSRELNLRLEKEIAALREKARKDLLDELSGKQKAKLKELVGDDFELKEPNRRSRLIGDPG